MTSLSIRDLVLQPVLSGRVEELCQQHLSPLFGVAQDLVLVSQSATPEALARLTWGIAPALRVGVRVSILLLIASGSESEAQEEFEGNWSAALKSKVTAERLSAFKFFQDQGQLRVRVRTTDTDGGDALARHIDKGPGVTFTSDADGNSAVIAWSASAPNSEPIIEVCLQWSFGDPSRSVQKLKAAAEQVSLKEPSGPCSELERLIRSRLATLPAPSLPWEERFLEEVVEPSIALYEHQSKAVDGWFANSCRGIFKMCTGAGKTISSLAAVRRMAKLARDRGENVLPVIVTVPTRILADQWCQEIRKMGFDWPVQAYNSRTKWHPLLEACLDVPRDDAPSFVVSTYSTFADPAFQKVLQRQERRGQQALWIADEVHNLASPRLLGTAKDREGYFTARLGLSATPEIENELERTERLMNYFGGIVGDPYELKHGIRDQVLCEYRYFPFPCYLNPDLGRKYLDLLQKIDSSESHGKADISLYREKRDLVRKSGVQVQAFGALLPQLLKSGKRLSNTLVYCPPGYGSVTDSRGAEESDNVEEESDEVRLLSEVRETLLAHQIEVSCILGETPAGERAGTLHEFALGRIQVVCAIGCLDEGVDVPSIERAVVLSSVNRKKQFIQRRGRILRRSRKDPAKVAEIYDIIVLPHGSHLPTIQAESLLRVELDRYQEFAQLALNRSEADRVIQEALAIATGAGEPLI